MNDKKMKVLLYLKKSGLDRSGKAPIMGRITLGRSMIGALPDLSRELFLR